MILDDQMCKVFGGDPDVVSQRLERPHPDHWHSVFVGDKGIAVSIAEYRYGALQKAVVDELKYLLKKKDRPAIQRNPERFEVHIEATASRIIQAIIKGAQK